MPSAKLSDLLQKAITQTLGAPLTEEELLLRAIAADHDSDSPRLVYADWLEERGNSIRADFIRLSCEVSIRRRHRKAWKPLWERYQQILNRNERRWVAPLKALNIRKIEFHRGVVEWVTINSARALSKINEVFDKFPTIRSAKITELHGREQSFVDQFLEIPCMQQLHFLDLEFSRLGGIEAEKIGQANYLNNVETLRIAGNPIHQRGLDSILRGPGFPNLKRLDISNCNLGDEFAFDETFDCPRFKKLEAFKATEMFCAENVSAKLNKLMKFSHVDWKGW